MSSPLLPRDPTNLGDYTLTGRMGSGGFGVIFQATAPSGDQIAIKLLNSELSTDPTFRSRLAQEGQAMEAVRSDRTARVIEVVTDGPDAYLVMELIDGKTLDEHMHINGPFKGPELWFVAEGLIEGITAIHQAGIIHRDLKPANIMYGADGIKILDFGISAIVDDNPQTRTGAFMASAAWISPEQIRGDRATTASDIFMIGLILAYAATGEHPYGTGRSDAVMFRIAHQDPNIDGVPHPLTEAVRACLSKDPDNRPRVDALTNYFQSGGSTSLNIGVASGPHGTMVIGATPATTPEPEPTPEPELTPEPEPGPDNEPADDEPVDSEPALDVETEPAEPEPTDTTSVASGPHGTMVIGATHTPPPEPEAEPDDEPADDEPVDGEPALDVETEPAEPEPTPNAPDDPEPTDTASGIDTDHLEVNEKDFDEVDNLLSDDFEAEQSFESSLPDSDTGSSSGLAVAEEEADDIGIPIVNDTPEATTAARSPLALVAVGVVTIVLVALGVIMVTAGGDTTETTADTNPVITTAAEVDTPRSPSTSTPATSSPATSTPASTSAPTSSTQPTTSAPTTTIDPADLVAPLPTFDGFSVRFDGKEGTAYFRAVQPDNDEGVELASITGTCFLSSFDTAFVGTTSTKELFGMVDTTSDWDSTDNLQCSVPDIGPEASNQNPELYEFMTVYMTNTEGGTYCATSPNPFIGLKGSCTNPFTETPGTPATAPPATAPPATTPPAATPPATAPPTTTVIPTPEANPPTFALVPGVTPSVVGPGEQVTVRVNAQDDTGVTGVKVTFYDAPDPWLPQGQARLISGTPQDGQWELTGLIPQDVVSGYFLIYVLVIDMWGNTLNETSIGGFSVESTPPTTELATQSTSPSTTP